MRTGRPRDCTNLATVSKNQVNRADAGKHQEPGERSEHKPPPTVRRRDGPNDLQSGHGVASSQPGPTGAGSEPPGPTDLHRVYWMTSKVARRCPDVRRRPT